jgi:predicted SnoaL-like aldol condensation-catalyzing enzyme
MTMANTTPTSTNLERNRDIAVEFLQGAAEGRARELMRRYAAPDFVHHNPYFASDAMSLATAMDENARENPTKRLDVLRTLAEGPLVALHAKVRHTPDGPAAAVVHIFRFEDGRIKELWDIGQEEPAESPNAAGMF